MNRAGRVFEKSAGKEGKKPAPGRAQQRLLMMGPGLAPLTGSAMPASSVKLLAMSCDNIEKRSSIVMFMIAFQIHEFWLTAISAQKITDFS